MSAFYKGNIRPRFPVKKITSKSNGLILLLILLVAGWLMYKPNPKHKILLDEKPPGLHPMTGQELGITGIVVKFGSNPDGDIDKILLSTANQKIWLHFPPHTARQVTSAAKINQSIEATIGPERLPGTDTEGVYELKNLRSKFQKTNVDLGQIPAPAPRKGIEVALKGVVSKDPKYGNDMETNFILAGKQVLLPPHMARELLPLIRRANIILVKGYMRDSTQGFLSASGMNVIKPSLIQIDSITYKIR